jgi:KUP system potassium uptake protein
MPLDGFVAELARTKPLRVEGTAVFLSRHNDRMPPALLLNVQHNHVLHERVVILSVSNEDVPVVTLPRRAKVERLGQGFFRVSVHYGFMQQPGCSNMIERISRHGLHLDLEETSFFIGREMLVPASRRPWRNWRVHVFSVMARLALRPTDFLLIPYPRVVELWSQVEV